MEFLNLILIFNWLSWPQQYKLTDIHEEKHGNSVLFWNSFGMFLRWQYDYVLMRT